MTRPGTRADKIAAIHSRRENSAAFSADLSRHLAEVGARLADIERVRTDLLERVDDDVKELLMSWSVPLRDLSDRIALERTELQRVHTRLGRTALNVGMVGRARQGKSRFLQSLTGLTSQEIPDGAVGFCTGVPSIVQHMPGGTTYADVYFHTPESFMSDVIAPYYEKLDLGAPPTSPIGFSGKPLPNLPPDATAEQRATYDHLSAYHRTYPEYQSLIGAVSPRQIGAGDIRGYVAQDDVAGQRTYTAFRAVRQVQIATEFPAPDLGGVSVIDLPGLGDTNLGDSAIMLSALKDSVDLVLFLRRPAPEGDSIHDYDIKLYDIARDSLPEIPMERRSFLILNHRQSQDNALDNMASCQAFAGQVAGSPIRVASVMVADCSSSDEVAAAFDRVVDYLLDNIDDLDRMLLDERIRRAAEINEQARLLAAQLQSLGTHAQSADEWFMEFQALFSEAYEDLSAAIERLVGQYEAERDSDDSKFAKAVAATVESAREDDRIPSITEIERQKAVYGTYAATYSHLLDETRAHLSRKFLHLDVALKDAVRQMWENVAKVLADAGRLGQIDELKDTGDRDFLIALADRIPPKVRKDADSEVQYALRILIDFDLSYRSFIQHRIRDCLDGMQADHPMIEIPPNVSPPPDAVFIREALSESYKGTLWECEQRLQDLLKEPNRALFGIVEEFRDRVLRSRQIQNEWRTIYQDVRAEVWVDQFAALAESAVHLRLWNETVGELRNLINGAPRRPDA